MVNENFFPNHIESLVPIFSKQVLTKALSLIEKQTEISKTNIFTIIVNEKMEDFPLSKIDFVLVINKGEHPIEPQIGGGVNKYENTRKKGNKGKYFKSYFDKESSLVPRLYLYIYTCGKENESNFKSLMYKKLAITIAHELTHLFEYYQIQKKENDWNMDPLTWTEIQMQTIFTKYPLWISFLHYIYLHNKTEINARYSELFQGMKVGNNTIPEEQNYIQMLAFDANLYLENLIQEIQENHKRLKISTLEQVTRMTNRFIYEYLLILKEENIDDNLKNKLISLKNKPLQFFKFFEKRFHYAAETYFKKIQRKIKKYSEFKQI